MTVGGILQTSNSFTVARGSDALEVTVEHEHYETFRSQIEPSTDVTLDVSLRPKAVETHVAGAKPHAKGGGTRDKREKDEVSASKAEPPAPPPAPKTTESDENRIKRGRRGTSYMEDFD